MARKEKAAGLMRQLKLLRRSPSELKLLYVLNFLNSYKYFSMALVLPLIATEEYGFSDVEAGGLYGAWGLLITFWGVVASLMVDHLGVKTTALTSSVLSVAARAVFVFARTRSSLLFVIYVMSPIGDGMFDPCFNVGVKKLTTPDSRPFAYAIAYTVMNCGGAFSDNLTDVIRRQSFHFLGQDFSGLRCVLLSSMVAMMICTAGCLYLRPLDTVDPLAADQLSDERQRLRQLELTPTLSNSPANRSPGGDIGSRAKPKRSKRGPGTMRRMDSPRFGVSTSTALSRSPQPNKPTIPGGGGDGGGGLWNNPVVADITSLFYNPDFWRVATFVTAVLFVSQQWRFMDLLMPKFVMRFFGEDVPFANLASINLWGCVFLPPLVASQTAHLDDITLIIPGLWIMACAPAFLVFHTSVASTAAWIAMITVGEVIWSPRSSSYAASMAPEGQEGMFLMLSSWPTYLTKYPAGIFSGWLLGTYLPACPECSDRLGHYEQPYHTCVECPGWHGDATSLWTWVLCLSLISPIIVTIVAPCLRPNTTQTGTPVPYNIVQARAAANISPNGTSGNPSSGPNVNYESLVKSEVELGGVGSYGAEGQSAFTFYMPQEGAGGDGAAGGGIRRTSSGGALSSGV